MVEFWGADCLSTKSWKIAPIKDKNRTKSAKKQSDMRQIGSLYRNWPVVKTDN